MNYKESTISGSKWQRAATIVFYNPHEGIPSVTFNEEEIAVFGTGDTYAKSTGTLSAQFTDPSVQFNLLNPADNTTVIGSATYQDAYVMLLSLYLHLANLRDNPVVVDLPPVDPAPVDPAAGV
jgi:hypothetical protein